MDVSRPQGSAFDRDSCSATEALDPDPSKCQREATVWTLTATSSYSWGSPWRQATESSKVWRLLVSARYVGLSK